MSDLAHLAVLMLAILGVAVWTTLARGAAIDVEEHGGPGWLAGILFLFLPPAGIVMWFAYRDRESVRSSG